MAGRAGRPAALLLLATVVSGASGYVASALVPAVASVDDFTTFAVLWSVTFVLVGALGGVQQEVTRASSAASVPHGARATPFAAVVSVGAGLLVAASSFLFLPLLVRDVPFSVAPAVAVGVAGYAVVAVVCGRLYGVGAWTVLAVLIASDGVLRLVGVAAVLAFEGGVPGLAWAIAVPFPLAPLLAAPFIVRRLRTVPRLDVGPVRLGWNAARLVAAAAATSLLLTGMPAVLRLAFPDVPAAELAPVALELTLLRAPLLIPVLALQSLLIVRFRERREWRHAALPAAAIAGGGVVAAGIAAIAGPMVLRAAFGEPFGADPLALGLVVASSGLLGALIVLSAALVADNAHRMTLAAWSVAGAATIALLVLPLPFGVRAGAAMSGGALVGVVVALVSLRRLRP